MNKLLGNDSQQTAPARWRRAVLAQDRGERRRGKRSERDPLDQPGQLLILKRRQTA